MNQPSDLSRRDFQRLVALTLVSVSLPVRLSGAEAGTSSPIRLHFNENPLGLSPKARAAMKELLDLAWQYPGESRRLLHDAVAALHGVARDFVLLGNGSSEILTLAAQAFVGPGRPLVVADPTYDAMAQYAGPLGADVRRVALGDGFVHAVDAMLEASAGKGLVYVCNPNNPTATITPKAAVRRAIESAGRDAVVVVDEAYHHYVTSGDYETVVPLVAKHANLVVLRTFSKIYGMAGLRCGYAVAQPATLQKLSERQSRNNINVAALLAARASLADDAWAAESKAANASTRKMVIDELAKRGFRTMPSEANFLMVNVGRDSREVTAAMREKGVLVGRPFPPLNDWLRVTIGTRAQMERFLDVFG
jgi:histidinol-phosphate aminotransferase